MLRNQLTMEKVWPWLTSLPSSLSGDDNLDSLHLSLPLISSADKSILLRSQLLEKSSPAITFSISLLGFNTPEDSNSKPAITLWVSNPYPLSSPLNYAGTVQYQLLIQLAQEIITLSPSPEQLTSAPPALDAEAISRALDEAHQSAPSFFALVLLCRLFWLCAVDAPAEAGSLFFGSVVGHAKDVLVSCRPALRSFLIAIGIDWEERFMRSLGYMVAKCCILQDLQVGPAPPPPPTGLCMAYATNSHGLWILRGYAPISAMNLLGSAAIDKLDVKDSVLRYSLAHQQLEAVIQLEYQVSMRDPRFISVNVRVNNVRLHVTRLGFGKKEIEDDGERHFPSRVRIWVGPGFGSAYASGLSLGRSTGNPERETETVKVVKGNYNYFGGSSKTGNNPSVKVKTRSTVRSRAKNWTWEQEADGNAGVFEGVLCDGEMGTEVATGGGDISVGMMRKRYSGAGRVFSKGGGVVVVGGEEVGVGVGWRVGREMEGRVFKWRIGGRVWVSYHPNELKSGYFETRCVEWREEVDLPLVFY